MPISAESFSGVCRDDSGVNLVIDYQDLPAGASEPQAFCVTDIDGDTAVDAFTQIAEIEGTQRWGNAFICRVDGQPDAEREDCVDTPASNAHWSYWTSADGEWSESATGASGIKVHPGEWHGLSFALNKASSDLPEPRIEPTNQWLETRIGATDASKAIQPASETGAEAMSAPMSTLIVSGAILLLGTYTLIRNRQRKKTA